MKAYGKYYNVEYRLHVSHRTQLLSHSAHLSTRSHRFTSTVLLIPHIGNAPSNFCKHRHTGTGDMQHVLILIIILFTLISPSPFRTFNIESDAIGLSGWELAVV